jgi:hypothetical protein
MHGKKPIDLSDRRGLANALVPNLPPTKTVPTKTCAIPVNDESCPENLNCNQVIIQATPTPIVQSRPTRAGVKLTNLGTTDVYYRQSDTINTGNGDLLPGGRGQWVFIATKSQIWGIVASGTQAISFAEVYD